MAEAAAAPVIKKYTGVLGAVDVFTAPTAFSIPESIRLDLGAGQRCHRTLALHPRMGAARPGALHHQAQARARIPAWIDDYNHHRRHSALGILSQVSYEKALQAGKAA